MHVDEQRGSVCEYEVNDRPLVCSSGRVCDQAWCVDVVEDGEVSAINVVSEMIGCWLRGVSVVTGEGISPFWAFEVEVSNHYDGEGGMGCPGSVDVVCDQLDVDSCDIVLRRQVDDT